MKKFKKLAGIALGAMLAVSAFASGNFAPVTALEGVAEEAESVQTYAEGAQSNEMAAYMFVHFVGDAHNANPRNENDEQIYFSVSQDGTNWTTLNNKKPILKSSVGEGGVRDPHIVRAPEGSTGKKFYLIATDLSIWHRAGGWGESQTKGSDSIVIWDSNDLVNWSEPRIRKIARDDAGCTWAPESIWDNEKQAFMVFWAAKTQDSWTHRIYRCYTTDFDTFTEPELYIESDVSWIDTTFLYEDGVYYRFTKNEHDTYVFMEKSTSLSGEFELVNTYSLNGSPATEYKGYEGPTAYKLNGEDKWCLLLDNYSLGGYKPFVTDDISKGEFVSGTNFNFNGTTFRHGTVIPITQSEYNALTTANSWKTYSDFVDPAQTGELVFELNFDGEDLTPATGNATVAANGGTLTYGDGCKDGTEKGKAVQFSNDGKYISITGENSPIKGLESFTVSFAVKPTGNSASWFFFAAPNANEQTYKSEKYIGALFKKAGLLSGDIEFERYNSNDQDRPAALAGTYTKSQWMHVTLVYLTTKNIHKTYLYINGELKQKLPSTVNLKYMLRDNPVIQLGRANWGENGEYASGLLDEFRIHNYALSASEVENNYKSAMGKA